MKFFQKRKNIKWTRLFSAVLVAMFILSLPISQGIGFEELLNGQWVNKVWATSSREELNDAEEELEDAKETVANLTAKAEQTAEDLAAASQALNVILAAQQELQIEIDDLQAEIDQADLDLQAAMEKRDEEYESMKLRIQFMYENDASASLWSAIASSQNFAEALNRLEYITEVYQADRELMTAYEDSVQRVEDLQVQLADAMTELLAKQEEYNEQQESIAASIALLQQMSDQYASQIAAANEAVSQHEQTVNELAERVRREEAAAAARDAASYDGGGSGSSGLGDSAYLTDDSNDPAFTGNVSPEELLAYAYQFVGNPYVWGGNSLTEGCDCSGFVHLIYGHFGYSTPRYSQAFKTVGQPVSYNNMKPGDIIVYPGHVAIYYGNGIIIEAQSTRAGITCNRSVNCHTITAIRRLL